MISSKSHYTPCSRSFQVLITQVPKSPGDLTCKDRASHAQPSSSAPLKVKFRAACMAGCLHCCRMIRTLLPTHHNFFPPPAQISYLCLEAFYQNGNQKVEEHVIAEGHQGHEVEGCPWGCRCHPIVQDHVPVLLSENLQRGEGRETDYSTPLMHGSCIQILTDILISSSPFDLF